MKNANGLNAVNTYSDHRCNADQFFREHFGVLNGVEPFPWQRKLFAEFTQDPPRFRGHCPVPTGLGKTSVLAIWPLALAYQAMKHKLTGFPRRLAYVVNRRTVVDQATTEAGASRKFRAALSTVKVPVGE
jgi:CRISPR-associated endonuclease/helicase Cas3